MCLIYNFAPKYREAIFSAIDRRWDCRWVFGVNGTDIKGLDTTLLKKVETVPNVVLRSPWYWQKGVLGLTGEKDLNTFFILGDPHCLSSWLLALKLRFFHPQKRLYCWTHGWYGKETRATKWVKKAFFKLMHGVFLYGNHARELMLKEGFAGDRLFVIHNSLNHSEQVGLRAKCTRSEVYTTHFGNSDPVLLFVGRLTAVKKLDMLLDAVAELSQTGRPCNLILVGDGAERAKLEKIAGELGIAERVWFYGACYDDHTNAELIYNADLCVAPGNVGLTAMHAMVFGTPVISHSDFKWQMPEFEAIRPGSTGDFFERDNLSSLVATIRGWLDSHSDREAVRQACYEEIDTYWTPEFQMKVLEKNLIV